MPPSHPFSTTSKRVVTLRSEVLCNITLGNKNTARPGTPNSLPTASKISGTTEGKRTVGLGRGTRGDQGPNRSLGATDPVVDIRQGYAAHGRRVCRAGTRRDPRAGHCRHPTGQGQGYKSGRAIGRPRIDLKAEAAIRASLLAGHGILKTARLCGVSNGPVKRIKAAMESIARSGRRTWGTRARARASLPSAGQAAILLNK